MGEGFARSLVSRMIGAAKLDSSTYLAVKRDETATVQAAVVVAIVAVAQAIGAVAGGGPGVIGGLVPAFAGWVLWSGLAYLIGVKLFGGTATWGELLRTLGFAQTPSMLGILGVVPGMEGPVGAVVGVWLLITGVVAIRHALDLGTGRALITAVVGWVVAHVPIVIVHEMLG